jgi:tripartite-type tricarboxylate transporter receptor subunit TctC
MKAERRKFLRLATGAAVIPALPRAQTYPARPVTIVVPYAAGGATDIIARLIGQWLSEHLGQQFVIENRPGAGTNIGTEFVAKAAGNGYTLLLASTAQTINATFYEKLNFNFIRDIAPVAGIISEPLIMVVNPSFPVKTVPEFIAYAKANPGKISMASGGTGASPHMFGELFKAMAGISMVHVPYRGEAPALIDLIGGQVQVMFVSIVSSAEHIGAAGLPGFYVSHWHGLWMPKGTPAAVIAKLNAAVVEALADPGVRARLADLGQEIFPSDQHPGLFDYNPVTVPLPDSRARHCEEMYAAFDRNTCQQ